MPDDLSVRPALATGLRGQFQPSTWNAETRTVDVVWSTGAPVQRRDWWTDATWTEVLDVSPDAVDLSRLQAGAPVLDTHGSYSLDQVIGVVERAWIDNGTGRATIRFSDREDVAPIARDVATGILRNISVGYAVQEWNIVPAAEGRGEVRTAKRWTPYELSFVPIPADAGAQVRALPPASEPSPSPQAARAANQEPTMNEAIAPAPAPADADIEQRVLAAQRAERARVAAITALARQHPAVDADFVQQHIDAGTSIDAVRAAVLDLIADKSPKPVAQITRDEGETRAMLVTNAFEHFARVPGTRLEPGANEFRGASLLDFARMSVESAGIRTRTLSPLETFQRAMALHKRDFAGGMSTSDFPQLLANTANKMLRIAYSSAPRSFTRWTTQFDLPDFKSFRTVALGGAPQLTEIQTKVPEGGEVTYGKITDAAETWNLVRVGRIVAFTFEAMVNDDLSGFTRVPQMLGAAAARYESETVYGILTANAALSDSVALFHASHSNLLTGGTSALTSDSSGIAAVGALQAKLRTMTAPNGDVLNNTGRYLVVPAALETIARQLFSLREVPATPGAVNPFTSSDQATLMANNTIEVIAEGRLDASSTAAYYLMADPAMIDTIHWGYLRGETGPRVASELDFDTDGMKTKVVHIFGAKAVDYRGMTKSAGS